MGRIAEPLAERDDDLEPGPFRRRGEQRRLPERSGLERRAEVGSLHARHRAAQVDDVLQRPDDDLGPRALQTLAAVIEPPDEGSYGIALPEQLQGRGGAGLACRGRDEDRGVLHRALRERADACR
jgi:hypothetical protein